MKKLLASLCTFAFVIALICTMTGCPGETKKTPPPAKTPPTEKTTPKT